jgi:hypothetical protein
MPVETRSFDFRDRFDSTRSAAMRPKSPYISRRTLLAGVAVLGVAALQRAFPAADGASLAQDATPAAVASPAAGAGLIQSTGIGPVPSTGGSRPGPVSLVRGRIVAEAIAPVGLTVEAAGIDAGIENLRVVNGAMQDPTGPWVVAWYENLGALGTVGNIVMAGHIDYWNVGPSVFYNLAALQPGAEAVVSGDDGNAYPYTVEWVEQFDSTSIPLDDVIGPTDSPALTLITCGGAFDYATGQYLQRTVVRANRSGPAQPIGA